ncbi:MAG: protease inhibitor I42 family protein [Verrucomicrobia bacterium]|nr:protease inhibitor I42 family protein [Verrucomicrobiota bacterium]
MNSSPTRLALSVSLTAFILATGCATKERIVTVTESESGSTVNIGTGDRLRVELPSNPSTGYSWQTMELNSWVLARTKRPEFTPDWVVGADRQRMVGSGGWLTLEYEAIGAGTSPVKIAYSRPWETNAAPAKTFQLTVVVK